MPGGKALNQAAFTSSRESARASDDARDSEMTNPQCNLTLHCPFLRPNVSNLKACVQVLFCSLHANLDSPQRTAIL
jgi:hypothetical protein